MRRSRRHGRGRVGPAVSIRARESGLGFAERQRLECSGQREDLLYGGRAGNELESDVRSVELEDESQARGIDERELTKIEHESIASGCTQLGHCLADPLNDCGVQLSHGREAYPFAFGEDVAAERGGQVRLDHRQS